MKTRVKFLVLSFMVFGMLALANIELGMAAGQGNQGSSENVSGNKVQKKVQAGERYTFRFQERTNISLQGDVEIDANIECNGDQIGKKDFELELDGDENLKLTMICTENQEQLGLMKGNTYQVRNRNRYRYEEGFCAQIEVQGEFTNAQIKMRANATNAGAEWAYYNTTTQEWVTVQTQTQNGYLIANTNHFSTWTLLVPESSGVIDGFPMATLGITTLAALGASLFIIIKRKR